ADFDFRHRLGLGASWESPYFKSSNNAFARHALGGWGLGSVLSIRSGSPFNIYDCSNFNGTACPNYAPASGTKIARTGSATAPGGTTNIFNYIALPVSVDLSDPANPVYFVTNTGDALGVPSCTGLDHVGCTYTASGAPYAARNQFFGPGFWN